MSELFSIKPVSENVSFYLCDALSCAFYYIDRYHGNHPILEYKVHIVPLNLDTTIKFIGKGQIGYDKVIKECGQERLFPVNLFDYPYRIDPKPSRTVSQKRYEKWKEIVSRYVSVPENEPVTLQQELVEILFKYPEGRTLRQLLEEITSRPHVDADNKIIYKLKNK